MPSKLISLRVITPLFLYGANQKKPEIRAASVRGQLRYWFRAIEGARIIRLDELWEAESAVFGSTAGGSSVSIRFYPNGDLKTNKYPMLPHRPDKKGQSWQEAISPGQKLTLEIVSQPGNEKISPTIMRTLGIWLLLGGIGKRSRRMFGALEVRLPGKQEEPEGLANYIGKLLRTAIGEPLDLPHPPEFPTLHPEYSRVVVGTKGELNWEALMRDLFLNLLRSPKYKPFERTFGHATRDRRASPLIAQVRKVGDQYCPVLTAMRSKPDKDIKWNILDDFMDDAESRWKGKTVWGGRLAK